MNNVGRSYLGMLSVVIAMPLLRALLVIARLQRQAKYFDVFEMAVVIFALAGMWLSFRWFTRNLDDLAEPNAQRNLVLSVWRVAVFGALGILIAIPHLR
jgi:hypothetical protein